MSKKPNTAKKRSAKGKSDPDIEELERSKKDVRTLRDQLSRTICLAETSENRRYAARMDRIKSTQTLEEVRSSTQQHTAFLIAQHEMLVATLSEKVETLEENLRGLNRVVQQKDEELDKLKRDFTDTITERDLRIDRLKKQLSAQGAQFEDVLLTAVDSLSKKLGNDITELHANYLPWSQRTLEKVELEFLNPPILDEESTEYY